MTTDPKRELARELYLQGKKYQEIADEVGVSLSAVKSWAIRYWRSEKLQPKKQKVATEVAEKVATKRHRGGQPGNHNATGPPGNQHAVKHGFFCKVLPAETLELVEDLETLNPLDVLWQNIQIQYAAILRAQQIMYVKDQSDKTVEKIEEKYGLDKSFGEQYVNWLKGALHGDFGMSVKYAQPVSQVLGRKLPNTVKLAVASFILMILISFPLGILSAVYKDKKADYIIRFMSFIGISLPSFWVGMMMIYFFAVKMHWLPVGGSDSFKSLIMPSVTLSLSMSAYYIRRIRAVMVEQMNEEYINGCQARGIGRFRTIFFHVLPNSLLTVVTMLGMSFGGLLGGTMIVETVFSWNGIGSAAVAAISGRDYQLIQGYVMWMGCIYVLVNLLVDISYQWLDPRIRRGALQHEE